MVSKRSTQDPDWRLSDEVVPAAFQALVDNALAHFANPLALGQSPLALLALLEMPAGEPVPTSRHARGLAVQHVLRLAVEELRPQDHEPTTENPLDRRYLVLRDGFIDRPAHVGNVAVYLSQKYHVAERTVHNASRAGRIALADELWGRLTAALDTADLSPHETQALALLCIFRQGAERAVMHRALSAAGVGEPEVLEGLWRRQLFDDESPSRIAVAPLVRLWYMARAEDVGQKRLHRLVGDACATEGDILAAAYHYRMADEPTLAVRLLAGAAEGLIQLGQAQVLADELARLAPGVSVDQDRAALEMTRGKAHAAVGEWDRALVHYRAAVPLLTADPLAEAQVRRCLGKVHEHFSDYDAALAEYDAGLDRLRAVGPTAAPERARLHKESAATYLLQQAYPKALDRCQLALDELTGLPGPHLELAGVHRIAGAAWRALGEFEQALSAYTASLAAGQAAGDLAAQADAYEGLGIVYDSRGDWLAAIENYHRGLFLRESLPDRYAIARLHLNLGVSHRNLGDLPEAIAQYQESLKVYQQLGNRRGVTVVYTDLGEAYNDVGDHERARDYLVRAVTICQEELEGTDALPDALRNLAEAYLGLGELELASAHAGEALAEARRVNNRYIESYCWETLGRSHQALGEMTLAYQAYQQALSLFAERGHDDKTLALTAILAELRCDQHILPETTER